MSNVTYAEMLRDPRWQQKRLTILARDQWRCRSCEASDKELHVHHFYYRRDAKPWEYENESLAAVCFECHEKLDEFRRKLVKAIGLVSPVYYDRLLAQLDALAALSHPALSKVNVSSLIRASGVAMELGLSMNQVMEKADPLGEIDAAQVYLDVIDKELEERAGLGQ